MVSCKVFLGAFPYFASLREISPYRFALIGCGRIATRHAELIAQNGTLVATCDIILQKAKELATPYQAQPFKSIEVLLTNADFDIAVICTPNGLHKAHSIAALKAGKHVLCEKPMCIHSSDSSEMLEAAHNSGKKLFVVKQNRYNPPVLFLKELLVRNQLGKILSFQLNCFWNRDAVYYANTWKGTKELDGGILFTQFSHFIDLLYWLLGNVKVLSGVRTNAMHAKLIEFEDNGVATLQTSDGAIGTLHYTINSFEKNMEGSLTVFGEKGTVKIGGQYLNELEYFSVSGMKEPSLSTSRPSNDYGNYTGSMSNHDLVYENMLKKLKDAEHDFIEAEEAAESVEIIERIYAASPCISLKNA